MHRSLKHLRHRLGGKLSVPFSHTKKFSEGFVKPKTKKFEHQYDSNGDIVGIKCWYQSVMEMIRLVVALREILFISNFEIIFCSYYSMGAYY